MGAIYIHLSFSGNCRQAMMFYKKCLGGELHFQTIGESPLSEKMPGKMKDCILHSTLTNPGMLLMGSDIVAQNGLLRGNDSSLILNCDSEKQIRLCYKKLSYRGKTTYFLENSFWGALCGGLTDQFGIRWILYLQRK